MRCNDRWICERRESKCAIRHSALSNLRKVSSNKQIIIKIACVCLVPYSAAIYAAHSHLLWLRFNTNHSFSVFIRWRIFIPHDGLTSCLLDNLIAQFISRFTVDFPRRRHRYKCKLRWYTGTYCLIAAHAICCYLLNLILLDDMLFGSTKYVLNVMQIYLFPE